VAGSVLSLITTVREDTRFVSPTAHAGLNTDLRLLAQAASAVANDNGADPGRSSALSGALSRAIEATLNRTQLIIARPTETAAARATTQKLQEALMALRNQ
jgi:hypothetical protein